MFINAVKDPLTIPIQKKTVFIYFTLFITTAKV